MKRLFAMLLCGLLILSLCFCTKQVPPEWGSEGDGEASSEGAVSSAEEEWLSVMENGAALMPLIYSTKASDTVIGVAETFFSTVAKKAGQALSADEDYVSPAEYEILLGDTNRPESQELMATLQPYGYAIRVTETKLVIVAWDDACLIEAVDYFFETFLPAEGILESGRFAVRLDAEYVSDGSDNSAFFESLTASDTLVATATEYLFTMTKPGNTTWPQGGCVKDGYYYQAFVRKDTASNEANNDVIIVKYDLETGLLVKESPVLNLNHCNDITYNAKLGYFVVCHNNPNRTYVSYVDPETLTVVETVHIEDKIYSIDYNETTDRYVVGLSGGQSFCFLDGNLNKVDYYNVYQPTTRTASCTTQSVTSDAEYIYFVLYGPNVITVYDWDGNFVTLIELNLGSIEPESITVVRNVFYIGCGTSSGCKVYKVSSLVPKEES